jgi:hypothetical protein
MDIINDFEKNLNAAFADNQVLGVDAAKGKRMYMDAIKELSEEERDDNYPPLQYLRKKSDLVKIYELVKNKKLSNNKIKQEIKKLLKEPDQINDFLKSILGSRTKKSENTEATSTGGGAGAFETPLFGKKMNENKLKGGLSDRMTITDIAKKHKVDINHIKKQFTIGKKVELEHTNDVKEAEEITMDHLVEDPNYYTKLKKIETKEATSTSSSGQYDVPGFEDVKMRGNNPKGSGRSFKKPQLPGGKFVQVKKKCKRFPYCNQGDIKALNIFENETLKTTIKNMSRKYQISEDLIKNYILKEFETNKNK